MSEINRKQYEHWLTSQLKEIDASNRIHPVKIRHRRGDRGITLFLAHWNGQKWQYDFLKPLLIGDKEKDIETIRRASSIRTEKEKQIEQGIGDEFNSKKTLLAVITEQMKYRPNLKFIQKHIEDFTQGQPLSLNRVTVGWVRSFQDYLKTKVSNNSAVSYMLLFRAVLRRLQDDGWQGNPNRKKDNLHHEDMDRTFLTLSEMKIMADASCSNTEVKRAFLFSCFCGLRYGDVVNLTWDKIIKAESGELQIKFKQQKTEGFTFLPLGREAVKQLFANYDEKIIPLPETHVFNLPSKTWMAKCLKKWVRVSGIKKQVSYHTSRHSFAVAALASGIDIFTVSKLLGHSNVQTTLIYAKLLPEKMRGDVDKLPVLNVASN